MRPTARLKGAITGVRKDGQTTDHELAELNTRAVLPEQSIEEDQASRLING